MGAENFECTAKGKTAMAAFEKAVDEARYENGHGGYTGTIAEKTSFVVIPVPDGMDPIPYANSLIDEGDERVDDKWGPAGCIELEKGTWYFFGWASS